MTGTEGEDLGLAVAFYCNGNLVRIVEGLEDLHGLVGIGERLAVDLLDQVTRPQAEVRKLFAVAPRVDAVALLLPVDEVGRRADDVGEFGHVLRHDRLDAG